MSRAKLKAPFPAFGGKSRVAYIVWNRLGDVANFIEPFANSAAVLLARPHEPRIETVNDLDCYISNFWRSTKYNPDGVVEWADWPVNECDLHANHKWLVLGEEAAAFRQRMRSDPDFYDVKIAGRWVQGLCCWIGGGWCQTPESAEWETRPRAYAPGQENLTGVLGGPSQKRPLAATKGRLAKGVHSVSRQAGRPQLADARSRGRGVHNDSHLIESRPRIDGRGHKGGNSNAIEPGVLGGPKDIAGTCEQRRAWLVEWFGRLRDRLRTVRVCCGHWLRVCDSESVTTRLGTTGIFLDPPYPTHGADGTESRAGGLYGTDGSADALDKLRDEVLAYCLERGKDERMRIAVCGYDTDGYAVLEKQNWDCVAWKAQGGYGNRSEKGKSNSGRERIWFSPGCIPEQTLFSGLE